MPMKRVVVFLIILFGAITQHQRYSESEIIKLAKEYHYLNPRNELQRKFEVFESMNWRMPKDLNELAKQMKKTSKTAGIKKWNTINASGITYPKKFTQILRSKDSYFLSMKDSCFFFNKRWKLGCVLYESHCSLINIDPWHHAFRAEFIDQTGENIGEWDLGERFYDLVEKMSNDYAFKYRCLRDFERMRDEFASVSPTIVNGTPMYNEILYRNILSFTKDEPYRLYCKGMTPDSIWVEDRNGQRYNHTEPELTCSDFFQRIDSLAQVYFMKVENCQTILCPVPFVFGEPESKMAR